MKISKRSRELYDRLSKGFNTWDVHSVTAHVLLPQRLRVNVGFFLPHVNQYTTENAWEQVERFGEHTVDGSYTEVEIRFRDGLYRVESSAAGESLVLKVTPLKPRFNMHLSLEVGELFGRSFSFAYEDDAVIAQAEGERFLIRSLNPSAAPDWDPVVCPHLVVKADEVCYFTVNSQKTAPEIDALLTRERKKWLDSVISAQGDLGEGIAAMRRCLLWNMVYDFKNRRVVTPVSRNWCRRNSGFGDYVLFCWDTFFAALMYGLIDRELAYSTCFSLLEEATPEGMIPNYGSGTGWSRDRSEPQVGALCVWKLYVQYHDKWFLEECFEPLLRWNEWRFRERDKNGDGLLELASQPWTMENTDEPSYHVCVGEKQGAMWESGLDNSTMWDKTAFHPEKHCLEHAYVGLNALMVVDCEMLEKIALEIGRPEDAAAIRQRRLSLSERIEQELWDEKTGCYLNKNWDGAFDPCLSLTHFYTITAGLGRDGRRERMLREHLLNPEEFWGEYMIPNISRSDASFPEQEYWRGRIWAPTNFLVNEGIVRIGQTELWDDLVSKGLSMFIRCWRQRGVVGENYNAVTGEAAEPDRASDRFYHWGALLVYMAVDRVVNFNEWTDRTEQHSVPGRHIVNLPVGERKISV